jgi:ribokinase
MSVALTVVGSINLDLVVRTTRLPRPGETLSDASFTQVPGGKGANQAVAAAKLGAQVTMIGAIGTDPFAEPAVAGLREAGVTPAWVTKEGQTGVALIAVDDAGENTIVVAPGVNMELQPADIRLPDDAAILCQLEIPVDTAQWVGDNAPAEFMLNAAPAREGAPTADVVVVNRYEFEVLSERSGLVVVTEGAAGAVAYEDGVELARATPPPVTAVDGTAAGDAFTACLAVSVLEGRPREEALRRACIAGALAASKFGAQSSLPTAAEVDALL